MDFHRVFGGFFGRAGCMSCKLFASFFILSTLAAYALICAGAFSIENINWVQ